jgi:hypothetical protein
VYFPSPKRTIPRNSRRDMLPLEKGLFQEFRRDILYSLSRKGLFHQLKKLYAPSPKRAIPGNS